MDYRLPNGFMSFLQGQSHPSFTYPTNQQLGFQYPIFPMLPPPPSANPFSPPSDPRSPTPPPAPPSAPPSGKRKRVTIDVEAIEEEKQRLYYTKDEDVRLVSAWLNNSVNPIEGNAKKREYYSKEVADAYNSTTESDHKRDIKNLKNHWYKTAPKVTSFNGCYNQINDTYASGRCDRPIQIVETKKLEVKSEKDMTGKSIGSLEDMRHFFVIQVRRIWQEVSLNFENGEQ